MWHVLGDSFEFGRFFADAEALRKNVRADWAVTGYGALMLDRGSELVPLLVVDTNAHPWTGYPEEPGWQLRKLLLAWFGPLEGIHFDRSAHDADASSAKRARPRGAALTALKVPFAVLRRRRTAGRRDDLDGRLVRLADCEAVTAELMRMYIEPAPSAWVLFLPAGRPIGAMRTCIREPSGRLTESATVGALVEHGYLTAGHAVDPEGGSVWRRRSGRLHRRQGGAIGRVFRKFDPVVLAGPDVALVHENGWDALLSSDAIAVVESVPSEDVPNVEPCWIVGGRSGIRDGAVTNTFLMEYDGEGRRWCQCYLVTGRGGWAVKKGDSGSAVLVRGPTAPRLLGHAVGGQRIGRQGFLQRLRGLFEVAIVQDAGYQLSEAGITEAPRMFRSDIPEDAWFE